LDVPCFVPELHEVQSKQSAATDATANKDPRRIDENAISAPKSVYGGAEPFARRPARAESEPADDAKGPEN
jgi:hypothetical protein